MADTTRSDVEAIYGNSSISDADKDAMVSQANRLADQVFGGQKGRLGEVEGNEKDFKTLLAAHFWTLREGETQSESQTGGSVTYNWSNPNGLEATLTETRYGRMARTYIREGANISVEVA